MNLRVAMIGVGNAGSAVARALLAGGASIDAVINTHLQKAKTLANEVGARSTSTHLSEIPATITFIVIAVPTSSIASVARELARLDLPWKRVTVAHISGAFGRDVLCPVAARGARVLALHPAFPFPSRKVPSLRLEGIGWGIDSAPRDWAFAQTVVRAMHGVPVRIPANGRIAYHTACAMISNYTVTLAETATGVARNMGLSRDAAAAILFPLLAATVENIISSHQHAVHTRLTGPIMRGDIATVKQHLHALRRNNDALALYRALGLQTVKMLNGDARSDARSDARDRKAMIQLLTPVGKKK